MEIMTVVILGFKLQWTDLKAESAVKSEQFDKFIYLYLLFVLSFVYWNVLFSQCFVWKSVDIAT